METICRLCRTPQTLVKSHIIPQFLYKTIFDGANTHQVVEGNDALYKRRLRTGIYDSGILCKACDEGILGSLDHYGANVWNGYHSLDLGIKDYVDEYDPRVKWRQADKVDAERFKKFLLSILWRASITSSDFFINVDLGDKHTEAIRLLLLGDKAADDYDIILGHYSVGDPKVRQFMSTIQRYRSADGKHYYCAMISGIQIHWFISANGVMKGLEKFSVNNANRLKVIISPLQGFRAIRHFLGERALSLPMVEGRRGHA
jgi:hypothetical protein